MDNVQPKGEEPLSPAEQALVDALSKAPMDRVLAAVYLQSLMVGFLEEQVEGFKRVHLDQGASEKDRADAGMVAKVGESMVEELSSTNALLMNQRAAVQVVKSPVIHIPGAKLPRG